MGEKEGEEMKNSMWLHIIILAASKSRVGFFIFADQVRNNFSLMSEGSRIPRETNNNEQVWCCGARSVPTQHLLGSIIKLHPTHGAAAAAGWATRPIRAPAAARWGGLLFPVNEPKVWREFFSSKEDAGYPFPKTQIFLNAFFKNIVQTTFYIMLHTVKTPQGSF